MLLKTAKENENRMKTLFRILGLFYSLTVPMLPLKAATYHLDIDQTMINMTGKKVNSVTVNGTIPGPTLFFKENEEAVIAVTNHMNVPTSIHWHGLLLPGAMDGVPGFNGFPGIAPHQTFIYRFPVRQSGTYWYHAHSGTQEQAGLYGALVILPQGAETIKAEKDYVLVLSDFTSENTDTILQNLKLDSGYYNYAKRTLFDFIKDAKKDGWKTTFQDRLEWGKMRMEPTDLSDVSGYTFLINGKPASSPWLGLFLPGERVRLRFINASSMTFYDVRIPGLKMEIVQADGQNIMPVLVDEFRLGIAETYDVIVSPPEDKAYTIAAEPIDRTGFALATLATKEGVAGEIPVSRPRTLLTMSDMGMEHAHPMVPATQVPLGHPHAHHEHHHHHHHSPPPSHPPALTPQGWEDAATPAGMKALSYKDLRALKPNLLEPLTPQREIEIRLNGNMERYIWTMNGKKYDEGNKLVLTYGERVRLKFINETMMAHPMHLHGMFMQLENGQPLNYLPHKHTVIVPPGKSLSTLLTVNEPDEWAFHCHLLYHMESGMMTKVIVENTNSSPLPPTPLLHHTHVH